METRAFLEEAGFEDIVVEDTGAKYAAGYKVMMERAETGTLPPLGIHILLGETGYRRYAMLRATSKKAAPIRFR